MNLTDKFFSKEEKENILELFRLYAPSGKEEPVIKFVEKKLQEMEIRYDKDVNGNIFYLKNKNKPLLSAHMDSVVRPNSGFLINFMNIIPYCEDEILKGMGNIGGDDKCGVFLILLLLKEDPTLNFVFSVEEECGGTKGIKAIDFESLKEDKSIQDIPYGLVLDRRNKGDIICSKNSYGSKEFEDALAEVGKEFGYLPETGTCSDANTISNYMNCVNLSVAYYNAHSETEFVSLCELRNTYEYIKAILKNFEDRKFAEYKKTETTYTYNYNNYQSPSFGSSYATTYYKNWCYECRAYHADTYFSEKDRLCKNCAEKKNEKAVVHTGDAKHWCDSCKRYVAASLYDKEVRMCITCAETLVKELNFEEDKITPLRPIV